MHLEMFLFFEEEEEEERGGKYGVRSVLPRTI